MFKQDYFTNRRYAAKDQIVKLHVLEVLKWASKVSGVDVLDGQGKRVLDVGCAYGYTSNVLSALGYEACGCDVSLWAVRQAKAFYCGDFLVCDAQQHLPFRSESFDLVTCFDVLEHLRFPEQALQNLVNVGADLVLCTTPNRNVEKPLKTLFCDVDETHINVKSSAFWERSVKANLKCADFTIETFYDVAVKFAGHFLFKSIKLPYFGLTLRIMIKK